MGATARNTHHGVHQSGEEQGILQALRHPGQEQVRHSQVPLRRPLHEQGHHLPGGLLQDQGRYLPRYGCPVGLTNYSAAYCVGLLCARRLLKKFGLDEKFEGTEEVTAEFEDCFVIGEDEDGPSAFHALLDVGLKPTTLGSKIFAALKGAFDGGLEIPHNEEKAYDAEEHKDRILGGHVKTYMESLQEEEPEEYEAKFSAFVAADVSADDLEDMYLECHKKIRESPELVKTDSKAPAKADQVNRRTAKKTNAERKATVQAKKDEVLAELAENDDDDDDEDEDDE